MTNWRGLRFCFGWKLVAMVATDWKLIATDCN